MSYHIDGAVQLQSLSVGAAEFRAPMSPTAQTAVLRWFDTQRGKDLALQRQNLKLFRSPFRTLYYFFGSASAATGRGVLWLLNNRVTLFLLLPILVGYIGLKGAGAAQPPMSCPLRVRTLP